MSWDLARPVAEVAPSLLGATLRHGGVAIRLTEVEAYDGPTDPASHAYRGPTPRNAIMFGPPGHLYVYFSYGMHWAANVICGPEGHAAGILLRAGEVIDGIELARSRRGRARDRDLARGPGRLCSALGLTAEHKGCDLFGDSPVRLESPREKVEMIMSGPRVGVSLEADRPWRFWVAGSRFVSDYKRNPRAPVASPDQSSGESEPRIQGMDSATVG
jgi:DNA-3-methyladenine glycosylase